MQKVATGTSVLGPCLPSAGADLMAACGPDFPLPPAPCHRSRPHLGATWNEV